MIWRQGPEQLDMDPTDRISAYIWTCQALGRCAADVERSYHVRGLYV